MANHGRMSISALHRETGIDRITIAERLEKAGLEPEETSRNAKLYNTDKALAILTGGEVVTGEEQAKRRKLSADAEKAELVVRKLKGELVPIDSMKQAAGELIKTLYQRIVRVEPGIIAAKCVGKNALEIEGIVHDQMATVFAELRSMPEQFLSVEIEEKPND
jgi:hypothetical protein